MSEFDSTYEEAIKREFREEVKIEGLSDLLIEIEPTGNPLIFNLVLPEGFNLEKSGFTDKFNRLYNFFKDLSEEELNNKIDLLSKETGVTEKHIMNCKRFFSKIKEQEFFDNDEIIELLKLIFTEITPNIINRIFEKRTYYFARK